MRLLAITNMYPTPKAPDEGTFVEQQVTGLRDIGLDVDVLVVDRSGKGWSAYLSAVPLIRSRIEAYGPDLVHSMYGGILAQKTLLAAKNRPVVVSFCGSDLLGTPGNSMLARFRSWTNIRASNQVAREAEGIVVKSQNLRAALPSGVPHDKVRTIANGIDLRRFHPQDPRTCREKLGWNEGRFHIIFCASSGPNRKRFDLAKAAVDELGVGGVPVELHILRGVPHGDVPIWLNAGNVLLMTSRQEGSPNIVKEALACNRPVVSVDIGDVVERLDGIQGCHVAKDEPGDLAAKLRAVYEGPRSVDAAAKVKSLSLQAVALQLRDFYQEILAMPARPR